jgi:hypothetical protein
MSLLPSFGRTSDLTVQSIRSALRIIAVPASPAPRLGSFTPSLVAGDFVIPTPLACGCNNLDSSQLNSPRSGVIPPQIATPHPIVQPFLGVIYSRPMPSSPLAVQQRQLDRGPHLHQLKARGVLPRRPSGHSTPARGFINWRRAAPSPLPLSPWPGLALCRPAPRRDHPSARRTIWPRGGSSRRADDASGSEHASSPCSTRRACRCGRITMPPAPNMLVAHGARTFSQPCRHRDPLPLRVLLFPRIRRSPTPPVPAHPLDPYLTARSRTADGAIAYSVRTCQPVRPLRIIAAQLSPRRRPSPDANPVSNRQPSTQAR